MPLITADPHGWDDGFTLNPTAIRLERSVQNDEIITHMLGIHPGENNKIAHGVVVVLYRGIPKYTPGVPSLRSSVGLAVFTPEMKLIKRFAYPVVMPDDDRMAWDYNGVEDQRITRIGDTFYMTYCGFNPNLTDTHGQDIHICMAVSKDLMNWTKLGAVKGNVNSVPNKDAVILPSLINGKYMMLHRPCVGGQGNMGISIASSDSLTGEWTDIGMIMRPYRQERYTCSWLGAGSTPIYLGENRYLMDYHTGNYYPGGERDYFASCAILDFSKFDPADPFTLVESRHEGILYPETKFETNSPWPHKKTLNCVFPCGSYVHKGNLYWIYGGADAYVLALRISKQDLLERLSMRDCLPGCYDERLAAPTYVSRPVTLGLAPSAA